MKILFWTTLLLSLAANGWMLTRSPLSAAAPIPSPVVAVPSTALPVSVLEGNDPAALRESLRRAGVPDEIGRAIIDGKLRRVYRNAQSDTRVTAAQNAWWRSTTIVEAPLLRQQVVQPLHELMGRDPLDLLDAQNRYGFLPAEKARRLAEIDLDYIELEAANGGSRGIDRLKSELDAQKRLAEERRRDVLDTLTSTERAEYDLRFSGVASIVTRRFAIFGGTEPTYRVLKPLVDEFETASRALPKGETFASEYPQLQQRTMDAMVRAVGYEHALDYIWSGPGLFAMTVRTLRETGQPVHRAAQLFQLAAQTEEKARAIHADQSQSPELKRRALQELQSTIEPELNQVASPWLRQQLPEGATSWFTLLGEGRYKGFYPTLTSSGFSEVAPTSVTDRPPARSHPRPPLPRRS